MSRLVLFSVLIILIAFGCSDEMPLHLKRHSLSENDLASCKTDECPKISISFIKAVGPEEISRLINTCIEQQVINALEIGAEEQNEQPATIIQAMQEFVRTYQMHLAEFPDMPSQYTAEIYVDKSYQDDQLLSLRFNQYRYTGGAHGYGQVYFVNIDQQTGMPLNTKDLFNNVDGFRSLAENHFRTAHHIASDAPINSTGFWFQDDHFDLPKTIGFMSDEVVLLYNQYDIASYADGPIELRIPISEVQPFLSWSIP